MFLSLCNIAQATWSWRNRRVRLNKVRVSLSYAFTDSRQFVVVLNKEWVKSLTSSAHSKTQSEWDVKVWAHTLTKS